MANLSDILNSINKKTTFISEEEINLDYTPFIINKGMSYFIDTIMFANEMNLHSETPKYAQYRFYYHALNKKSRFSKWHKKNELKDIDIIKEYYNYSDTKAEQALALLNDEQIEEIRNRLFKGGKK